jgi:hypothetical protein
MRSLNVKFPNNSFLLQTEVFVLVLFQGFSYIHPFFMGGGGYFAMLSTTSLVSVVGLLINNEFERRWKEVIMA